MPFRSNADRGLSAKCCIRGEDIVFLGNWELNRATLTGSIWNWPVPDFINETKQPSLHELSCARNFAEKLSACWFKDFKLTDHEISSAVQANVKRELLSCFTTADAFTQTPDWDDDTFDLERVENLFVDGAKLKCTVGNGFYEASNGQDLWYWYQDYGQPSYQETSYVEKLVLDWFPAWHNYDRPIQFDVQFVGVFSSHEQSSEHNSYKYVLANILDKNWITQRAGEHEFYIQTNWGGTRAAQQIAAVAGHSIRPTVPVDGWASYTCGIVAVYPVIWPKYLQLP